MFSKQKIIDTMGRKSKAGARNPGNFLGTEDKNSVHLIRRESIPSAHLSCVTKPQGQTLEKGGDVAFTASSQNQGTYKWITSSENTTNCLSCHFGKSSKWSWFSCSTGLKHLSAKQWSLETGTCCCNLKMSSIGSRTDPFNTEPLISGADMVASEYCISEAREGWGIPF